jgi:hypothetical protein
VSRGVDEVNRVSVRIRVRVEFGGGIFCCKPHMRGVIRPRIQMVGVCFRVGIRARIGEGVSSTQGSWFRVAGTSSHAVVSVGVCDGEGAVGGRQTGNVAVPIVKVVSNVGVRINVARKVTCVCSRGCNKITCINRMLAIRTGSCVRVID